MYLHSNYRLPPPPHPHNHPAEPPENPDEELEGVNHVLKPLLKASKSISGSQIYQVCICVS